MHAWQLPRRRRADTTRRRQCARGQGRAAGRLAPDANGDRAWPVGCVRVRQSRDAQCGCGNRSCVRVWSCARDHRQLTRTHLTTARAQSQGRGKIIRTADAAPKGTEERINFRAPRSLGHGPCPRQPAARRSLATGRHPRCRAVRSCARATVRTPSPLAMLPSVPPFLRAEASIRSLARWPLLLACRSVAWSLDRILQAAGCRLGARSKAGTGAVVRAGAWRMAQRSRRLSRGCATRVRRAVVRGVPLSRLRTCVTPQANRAAPAPHSSSTGLALGCF